MFEATNKEIYVQHSALYMYECDMNNIVEDYKDCVNT